jgi:hypothetical protein
MSSFDQIIYALATEKIESATCPSWQERSTVLKLAPIHPNNEDRQGNLTFVRHFTKTGLSTPFVPTLADLLRMNWAASPVPEQ